MQNAKQMKSSDSMSSFLRPNLSTTSTEMEVPVTWMTPTTMAQMLASNWTALTMNTALVTPSRSPCCRRSGISARCRS